MRPVIGITCSFEEVAGPPRRERSVLNAAYSDAVLAAGGLPMPIVAPPRFDAELADELLRRCDALVFTGGPDLDPRHYGQAPHPETKVMHSRRDAFELRFYQHAVGLDRPTLAICLGCQVAAVACGGALVQHLELPESGRPNGIMHHRADHGSAFHPVSIVPGSLLARVVGRSAIEVNSRHHQAANPAQLPPELRPTAFAPDGVLEAVEAPGARFRLAVQWHPEDLIDRPEHLRLFEALVEAARH